MNTATGEKVLQLQRVLKLIIGRVDIRYVRADWAVLVLTDYFGGQGSSLYHEADKWCGG